MKTEFRTEGTYAPDKLIAGNAHLLVGRKVTIISGQNLVRGAVLGKITASGKYNLSLSAAADGSQRDCAVQASDFGKKVPVRRKDHDV